MISAKQLIVSKIDLNEITFTIRFSSGLEVAQSALLGRKYF